MKANVIFKNLGHQAIDATAYIGEQHQDIRAVISGRQRALNRIYLPTDSSDPGNQLLFFFCKVCHFFLVYILGGYAIKMWAMVPV